jgi:hypothetical protein
MPHPNVLRQEAAHEWTHVSPATQAQDVYADQRGMTGRELSSFMGSNYLVTATALRQFPTTMERFDGLS